MSLCLDADDDSLTTIGFREFADELRPFKRRRVDSNFVRTGSKQPSSRFTISNAAADCNRDKYPF